MLLEVYQGYRIISSVSNQGTIEYWAYALTRSYGTGPFTEAAKAYAFVDNVLAARSAQLLTDNTLPTQPPVGASSSQE